MPQEKTFFALTYPFSYTECCEMTENLENQFKGNDQIYFKRELLTYSFENRKVELLTISSLDKISSDHEDLI